MKYQNQSNYISTANIVNLSLTISPSSSTIDRIQITLIIYECRLEKLMNEKKITILYIQTYIINILSNVTLRPINLLLLSNIKLLDIIK